MFEAPIRSLIRLFRRSVDVAAGDRAADCGPPGEVGVRSRFCGSGRFGGCARRTAIAGGRAEGRRWHIRAHKPRGQALCAPMPDRVPDADIADPRVRPGDGGAGSYRLPVVECRLPIVRCLGPSSSPISGRAMARRSISWKRRQRTFDLSAAGRRIRRSALTFLVRA